MRSAAELQALAWRAVVKELGLADALRYRILFQPGAGDYLHERQEIMARATLESLVRDLAVWDDQKRNQSS